MYMYVTMKDASRSPSDDSGEHVHHVVEDNGVQVTVAGTKPNGNGDNTGGIFFKFFLGDAEGYAQMTRTEKLSLFKNELLLGLIIACAQIPESVAFAFLANVDPSIAIHSAWVMGLICGLFGGRPAMINGATGAFAAIISTFVKEPSTTGRSGDGVEVLFLSVILAGVFMLMAFILNLGRFVRIISYPIMLGFCNGLAIVIGISQLHPFSYTCPGSYRCPNDTNLTGDGHHHYIAGADLAWMIGIVLISMVVMEFVPRIPHRAAKLVPSSLLAILVAILVEFTIVRAVAGNRTDTIGDVAPFSSETRFPVPFFLDNSRYKPLPGSEADGNTTLLGPKKFNFDNLRGKGGQVLLQGFLLAIVGLIESLLTQEVVDKFTKTIGDGRRTIVAMGAGNIVSGLLGGMGGNAMIGLSTINCLNGGRGRLAPTITALVVMIMVMVGSPALNYVPVSALVGIMLVVVLHTFKWHSIPAIVVSIIPERIRLSYNLLFKIDRMDILVLLLVTITTYFLNLAYAIFLGVGFSALVFSWKSAKDIKVCSEMITNDFKVYYVSGPLFFGNSSRFVDWFDVEDDPVTVEAHFQDAKCFDSSSLKVLNALSKRYSNAKKSFVVRHLDMVASHSVYKSSRLLRHVELVSGDGVMVSTIESEDATPVPLVADQKPACADHKTKDFVLHEASV